MIIPAGHTIVKQWAVCVQQADKCVQTQQRLSSCESSASPPHHPKRIKNKQNQKKKFKNKRNHFDSNRSLTFFDFKDWFCVFDFL